MLPSSKNKSARNFQLFQSSDVEGSQENNPPSQIVLIVVAAIIAGTGVLTANWIVTRFKVSANLIGVGGSALFCAAWAALYPAVRRNKHTPNVSHWVRGGFILLLLWLAIRASR